jgi:3-hydroxybutyryl-CoA dehydrogenase
MCSRRNAACVRTDPQATMSARPGGDTDNGPISGRENIQKGNAAPISRGPRVGRHSRPVTNATTPMISRSARCGGAANVSTRPMPASAPGQPFVLTISKLGLSFVEGGDEVGTALSFTLRRVAIRTVGVIGCGLMGSGIAEVCARAGYTTLVRELNDELVSKGLDRILKSMGTAVERGKMSADERDAVMQRITGTSRLEDLKVCDLVIEAATENPEIKRRTFAELDSVCPPHAILASNTSSIPIIQMATATQRADKVLGMHFMNPVPVMPLIEYVRTLTTSDATLDEARAFGESLGKRIIVSKDRAGFIVNFLLIPYLTEAIRMLEQGFASREDIDVGMMLGTSYPMGPFTLLDFVGLDTTLYIADVLFDEFKDPRFAAPTLLRQMVAAGYLGRKTGRGFYDYSAGEKPPTR